MGKRGRKPKPTVLKILAGNPGRRPLNDQEPKPSSSPVRCPAWLDDEAKKKWRALVPELKRLGLLTLVDGDALAAYCQAWAEFRAATEQISKEGRTATLENGRVLSHPAVAQQRSAMQVIRQFSQLFGLDPSSRSALKAPHPMQADELEAFLADAN